MEKRAEQLYQAEAEAIGPPINIVEHLHGEALTGDSYENVVVVLDSVEALQEFRREISKLPFGSFCELVETVANIKKLPLSREERVEQTATAIEILREQANQMSPRVADLYQAFLAEIASGVYEPHFDMTRDMMADFKKVEEQRSDMDVLFSVDIPWETKLKVIKNRLIGYLAGAKALDRREGKEMDDDMRQWREEELKKAPTRPPEKKNESKPGVDPMERLKEGERAPAIWSIYPAWGGYYKEQSFSKWDNTRNVWIEDEYIYSEAETVPLSGNIDYKKGPIDITMNARVFAGQWVSLPVPYTHDLHKIEADGRKYQAQKDQNGDLVILIEGEDGKEIGIDVFLAPNPNKKFISRESEKIVAPDMPSDFSEETNKKLEEIARSKRGNIARARSVASYTRARIQYLAPKDRAEAERYNTLYNTSPKGFAGAVDEVQKGDCDVVNTYLATLCAKLNIPVRHIVGHSVKGKDKEGISSIHSGTGHGWSEVWNEIKKEWVRMDATPAGDPNLEEDEKEDGESAPGDYGEQEAIRPTDEQLEELRKKLAERKEKLSYTKEERQLAEAAGIELKEARQIVKEINEAEQTRLPNGELVTDALAKLFNAIVESRKTTASVYDGQVRRREGGEGIQDIVRHRIGILAGESDPMSREKPADEIKEEEILGGFDVYIIGDKSGSMQSTIEDEHLWQMQRRASYLIFSSLYRFERNLGRAGLQKENALSARTQGISFRGDAPDDIDLDKSLSPTFTAKDKVKMWRSLTNQGGGNGDVAALSYIYEQIQTEIQELEKRGVKDNRLRIVIVYSDGAPDSPRGVQALAEKLGKLNVVVVGMGLTETAVAVPIIYDTPYSRGDIARNINDLPAMVAKHIVLEAIKLFPEKARESAKRIIESSIAKFKKIK